MGLYHVFIHGSYLCAARKHEQPAHAAARETTRQPAVNRRVITRAAITHVTHDSRNNDAFFTYQKLITIFAQQRFVKKLQSPAAPAHAIDHCMLEDLRVQFKILVSLFTGFPTWLVLFNASCKSSAVPALR